MDDTTTTMINDATTSRNNFLRTTTKQQRHLQQAPYNVIHQNMFLHDLNTLSPTKLVEILLGPDSNVELGRIRYTGATHAAGAFAADAAIFGFGSGIVLTSGSVGNIRGPNQRNNTSTDNGLPGDEQLDRLVEGQYRNPTQDATVLEFDFVCPGTMDMSVDYVLASEEYNEFVNSPYNDVFGFFLNGRNIALLPDGRNTAINSVNCGRKPYETTTDGVNCHWYHNNQDGHFADTEMDGMTHVLRAYGELLDNHQVNTIRLAIADVGDRNYDSAVLLQSGSFHCVLPTDAPTHQPTPLPTLAPTPLPTTPTYKPTYYENVPNGSVRSEGGSNVDVVLVNVVGGAAGGGGGGDSAGDSWGGGRSDTNAKGEGSGSLSGSSEVGGFGTSAGSAFGVHGGPMDSFVGSGGWGGETVGHSSLNLNGGGGGYGFGSSTTEGDGSRGWARAGGRGFG